MKKKILLISFMVALFACLFAISISATTYNYYEDEVAEENKLYTIEASFGAKNTRFELISSAEGEGFAKTDADGNALTWYVVSDDLGSVTNGVRNIVVKSTPTIGGAVGTTDENGNYTYGTDTDGVSFSKKVVSVNFFGTNVTTLPEQAYMATYSLHAPGQLYQYCQVADGSYLLALYLPKTLTYVPKQLCFRSPVIVLEFEDNEVLYDNFGEGVSGFDPQWNTDIAYPFSFCANLKSLVIPEGIKTIAEHTFRESISLEYVKFPSTMTRFENNVFFHAIGIKTVVFGENMTHIGYFNSDYNKVKSEWGIDNFGIKYIYVPSTLNTSGKAGSQMFDSQRGQDINNSNGFVDYRSSIVFFVQGDLEYVKALQVVSDKNFRQRVGAVITYNEYLANQEYYDDFPLNNNQTHHVIVYNVPDCVPGYEPHSYQISVTEPTCVATGSTTYTCTICGDTYEDNYVDALGHTDGEAVIENNVAPDCLNGGSYETVVCCSVCNIELSRTKTATDALGHSYAVSDISYPNGYGEPGVKASSCASCNGTKEEATDALFNVLGFSASEAELGGITVAYKVNNEAIAQYEKIAGTEITYGVFAVLENKIDNSDIIDENGKAASGVISKEASSYNLEAFNLKLTGFVSEELMAAEIVMGAYVLESNAEGANVSYVQPKAPIDGNRYYAVSYDILTGKEEE